MVSTEELKNRLNLPIHREIVRLVLRKNKEFKYINAFMAPMLTAEHKLIRMERA